MMLLVNESINWLEKQPWDCLLTLVLLFMALKEQWQILEIHLIAALLSQTETTLTSVLQI